MCSYNNHSIYFVHIPCPAWVCFWSASPYHQPSVIVSPDSFVHRCHAISASEVQMSAALNQHPDALHRQAWLHSHRERGLWPTEGDRVQEGWQEERWKWKSTLRYSQYFTSSFNIIKIIIYLKAKNQFIYLFKNLISKVRVYMGVVANSPPLSGSWKFGSRPLSRTFAIFSNAPVWM